MAEAERLGGIALSIPASEEDAAANSSPKTLPRRLRRRLLEPKSPVSAEEIEAKLRDADLRRKQHYESVSSKARPKMKNPVMERVEDLSRRLEAKLNAAEQKRLRILGKELERLAKLDEQRQAAKTGLEQRFEKERDELETKVESRAQKAENNRMLLLKACVQRRAVKRQRAAQSLMQKDIQESKYKECVRAAIHQKRAAAERKRLGFLEAEKRRAHARLLRVYGVASSVHDRRETERRKMKDQLEDRLQRAKKLRTQYLRRRRGLARCGRPSSKTMVKNQERLVRMLERYWRSFAKHKKTTFTLARAYHSLEINEKSIESMPFEELALQINSVAVIQTVKALLDRLETRLALSLATMNPPSAMKNINRLLKHITPTRRGKLPHVTSKSGLKSVDTSNKGSQKPTKIVRYPARVFLCAYMIRRHPDAVFRERGEHEIALAESAANLIQEFELLIKTVLDGPANAHQENTSSIPLGPMNFRSQLVAFDKEWCSYLHRFVVWKAQDAKALEEDLARTHAAELSAVLKQSLSPEAGDSGLDRDINEAQKLNVKDCKSNKENDTTGIYARVPSSSSQTIFAQADGTKDSLVPLDSRVSSSYLLGSFLSFGTSTANMTANGIDAALASENELIVNEVIHDNRSSFADSFISNSEDASNLQVKVRETMEKAFWDGIMESMKQTEPDFSWVLKLMKEVRDELCEISPKDWTQEIVQTINMDTLSQLLSSGSFNTDYLGNILEFALGILLKLSAPASEDLARATHDKLMKELGEMARSEGQPNASYGVLVVKGLRFVLQQIQVLKKDISKARLKILEPLLKGPAGLEYLKKSFANRHGLADQASSSLPSTKQWLLSIRSEAENEWKEYADSLSAIVNNALGSSHSQGLPTTTLRTGGNISAGSKANTPPSACLGVDLSECKGETVDLLVRLGLLKLVSKIGGLSLEALPETLQLNLSRLRSIQSQIQKIILVSISVLILQQTLASENSVTNPTDLETVVFKCIHELYHMLDTTQDAGLPEIVETISQFPKGTKQESDPEKHEARKRVMSGILLKSIQAGDPVFTRVSQTVYLATRAAVLAGNNAKRKQIVESALRRVGAAYLSDNVIEVADVLILVAAVSRSVHGAWYEELLKQPR